MSTGMRTWIIYALFVLLMAGGLGLLSVGAYGYTLFVLYPVMLGGLFSAAVRPTTDGRAAWCGAFAVFLCTLGLGLVGIEGLFCILFCLPLTLPLGALGGWLVYRIQRSPRAAQGGLAMLILLPPAGLTWDATAIPQIFEVRSSIIIAATPEQVWPHIVSFTEMPEPREWYFHTGLAYPTRARMQGRGPGAVRYCDFSTGPVVEPIEVWDEPHLLRFRVVETPAPMREWTPYAEVEPKHLHGYMVSKRGEFRLTALPGNRTLLEGASWYRHGLWPAQYWRWWSDAIVHRVHQRVFEHIKHLSETDVALVGHALACPACRIRTTSSEEYRMPLQATVGQALRSEKQHSNCSSHLVASRKNGVVEFASSSRLPAPPTLSGAGRNLMSAT